MNWGNLLCLRYKRRQAIC